MSGDVQPRKRKDKRKKKDELGIEEPRGTAAALGEGDVFIHSHSDHGTGGHWCAKVIFFSLLAILITLIGLIILENRGLTELEANSVESKYSGVLEGWIEEAPEDDHYDPHTLDLKHPEDEDDEDHLGPETDHDHEEEEDEGQEIDDEHDEAEETESNEAENNEDEENEDEENEDDDESQMSEENREETEEVEERIPYRQYNYEEKYKQYDDVDDDDDDDDDEENNEDKDDKASEEVQENEDDNLSDDEDNGQNLDSDEDDGQNLDSDEDDDVDNVDENENDDDNAKYDNDDEYENDENQENYEDDSEVNKNEEDSVEDDGQDDDDEDEIEKIESERIDWEESAEKSYEERDQDVSKADDEEDVEDFQNVVDDDDDDGEPPIEQITTPPAGKPFVEIEEEVPVKPVDTLAEEAEYERRQEELRKQKEEAQGSDMWLKLAVGGALLVATHAVLRRATARDAPAPEEQTREETPVVDRRMTLIPEDQTPIVQQTPIYAPRPIIDEEVFKKPAPVVKNEPIVKPIQEEVKEKKLLLEERKPTEKVEAEEKDDEEKELYSDEEEIVEEEEEEDEEEPSKLTPQKTLQVPQKEEESETEEVPEDVEIIDDEQIDEEIEEEEVDEDEEEISDVDDAELLNRLEAKYGRLPEPERFGKHKEGGNSIEDEWPGEPSESFWREQLDMAEEELRQGALESCEERVSAPKLADSGRARWLLAKALDASAEAKRDNKILSKAISAYLNLLKMNERMPDKKLIEVAERAINRIQFRGMYLNAEPIYRLLIRRFPQDVNYRNNLTVSFLMANRADLADEVLKETLRLWPDDRIALSHYGFVLKNHHNKLEEAVVVLQKALEGDTGPASEPRFYYQLGDALLLLGRFEEAHEVHKRGAALGHFLSPSQRSLYNVPRLQSRPWWPVEDTPYTKLARALEKSWREILKEGEAAKALYEKEKEGLKERGEWSQLDLFVRGREIPGRCRTAPVTCALVRAEAAAAGCRRGQVKFSAMEPGTHVRPHVGPTNCRLRMHLGLSNTKDTFIRVDKETRQWQLGKTFIFDDSFEHEVWHNGTGTRLVLIVDVWHPQLTPHERRTLPAI